MAVRPLNSVAGFSVGEYPSTIVIDSNSNVLPNNLVVSNLANLGSVSNVIITGGGNGYFLQTNGSGNLSWSAINTTSLANGNSNVNIPVANGNVNISATGTANVLVITGTGINVSGTLNTTGNIIGGNLTTNGVLSVTGNANVGNLGTSGTISVSGNIQSNSYLLSNNITSVSGNLILTTNTSNSSIILAPNGTGIIDANGTRLANVSNPLYASDAATRFYVDNLVSTGISVHNSVVGDSDNNLSATYVNGGTSPTWTSIINSDTLVTGSAHNLSVNDVIVFGVTTNGITAGVPYFVALVPTTTSIKITTVWAGTPINTLVNSVGLSITSNVNTGVGATLTSTTNGPLTIEGYTFALNDRIIVLGQSNAAQNGVYYVSQVGNLSPGAPWILTRASDANKFSQDDATGLKTGSYFLVTGGSDPGEAYVINSVGTIVFGTTNITFAQFSQVPSYTAGTGLGLYPNSQFYISNTTVTSGSYGNGDRVATFTVNSQGQLTAAANTTITANAANLTGTTLASSIVNSSLTSVGTLTGLNVTGNISAANVTANLFGNGAAISTITGANVTGAVANATYATSAGTATSATTAGTVTTSAQPNITSVGTLTGLNVTGNVSAGNISATNGNLSIANVSGNIVLGNSTVTTVISWASANTSSISANQTIASFSVAGITGVEFLVKGIDSVGNKYSITSVRAVTDGTNVDWTTFGGVSLGGFTGSFSVTVSGGQIKLNVTPGSSNTITWTTQYRFV
jgi:hypothetical protein